jgi:hypothetical protein
MAIETIDPLIEATPDQQQDVLVDGVMTEDLVPEVDTVIADPLPEEAEPEQVEVAGRLTGLKDLLKSSNRTAESPDIAITPKKEPEGEQIVPTEGRVEGTPPETVFNLNQIEGPDDLKKWVDNTAQNMGYKHQKMSMSEMADKVKELGYSESFVAKIVNPNSKLNADPSEVFKMMTVLTDASAKSLDLANKVKAAQAAGNLTDELLVEFRQAVALEGAIAKGVKRKQVDVARSLRAFGEARTADVNRGVELEAVLDAAGGKGDTLALARAYSSAGSLETRVKMAEKSVGTKIKDIWMTTWINGILSSPPTHIKNMTANTMYMGLSYLEKSGAYLIGQARRFVGADDYMRANELTIDALATMQGFREGLALSKRAFMENKQITGASKLEYQKINDPFNIPKKEGESALSSGVKSMWGYVGKYSTLPGRALMAEDELFKAMNFRRSINTQAFRIHQKKFDEVFDQTGDPKEASRQAELAAADFMNDPPDTAIKEAVDFAGDMTFTSKLDGKWADAERLAQIPLLKIFIPFMRTPTNIAIQLNQRMPTAVFSKRFKEDWAAGGIRRDAALSRIMTGGAIMTATAMTAMEGKITGAGTFKPKVRDGMKAWGWQPYSFVMDMNEVPAEKIEELKKYTTVTSGGGKYYVSYAGLEPIGAIVGMAATMAEYSMMEENQDAMTDLVIGAMAGVSDYASELPMIQGVSELMDIVRGKGTGGEMADWITNAAKRWTEQGGEFALGGTPMLGSNSSMMAYIERIMNPERKVSRAEVEDYGDLDPFTKGFYDSWTQYRARNPLLSDQLEQPLDPITGQKREHAASQGWMRAFPFRISESKFSPAYDVLTAFNVGQYKPRKKIDGIDLNAKQYNRLIEIATSEILIDNLTLEDAIIDLPQDPIFQSVLEEDSLAAQDFLKQTISEYYEEAKAQLMEEEVGIGTSVEIKKEGKRMGLEKRIEGMLQ